MQGQSPPLEEILHPFFDQGHSSPRLFYDPPLTPRLDNFDDEVKPRERIDSEEFNERSFVPAKKVLHDAHCQTNPFDLDGRHKIRKQRKPKANNFDQLVFSSEKIEFPEVGVAKPRRKKSDKKKAPQLKMARTGKKRKISGLQSPKVTSRTKSPRSPSKAARHKMTPTLDSIGSSSGLDGKGSQKTCTSLGTAQRPSFEQKFTFPKGNEKLISKISKLRTFWLQKNRIQPQIFRFLVYDYDTRKLSFEFVDHSLKGILVDQNGDSPKEFGGADLEFETEDLDACANQSGRGRFQYHD